MITEENKYNLSFMSDDLLKEIIRLKENKDLSQFNNYQLINEILKLSEVHEIDSEIEKRVFLPNNTDLPFFAYGIFKPNQIAFAVIRDEVDNYDVIEIKGYEQFLRDGITFLFPKKDKIEESTVEGYKINFKPIKSREAYFKISNKEPQGLYEWKLIEGMNALVARDKNGFDEHFTGNLDSIIGWNDPYFHLGIEIIKKKNSHNPTLDYSKYSDWEDRSLFTGFMSVQMKFLLAYSMLERMAFLMTSFQTGSAQVSSVLSENSYVQAAILRVYQELTESEKIKEREVFSTLRTISSKGKVRTEKVAFKFKKAIEDENYKSIIKFYYQLRNNITHRGKSVGHMTNKLEIYLNELIRIVEYTLDIGAKNNEV